MLNTKVKSQFHLPQKEYSDGRTFMDPPDLIKGYPQCSVPENELISIKAHRAINGLKLFPGSAHLFLTYGIDKIIKLWEIDGDRRLIRSYEGHRLPVRCAEFNRTGREFASSGFENDVIVWDTESGEVLSTFTRLGSVTCMMYWETLFVGLEDGRILELDTINGSILKTYSGHTAAVNSLLWINNGKILMSTSKDCSIRTLNVETCEWTGIYSYTDLKEVFTTVKSEKGQFILALTTSAILKITVENEQLKIVKNKVFKQIEGSICQLSVSPDGEFVVCGDSKGHCSIWNRTTRRKIIKWAAHDAACVATLWNPKERTKLITASHDGFVKIWM